MDRKRIRRLIIILAVLLAISLCLLAIVLLHNDAEEKPDATVTDNLIATAESTEENTAEETTEPDESSAPIENTEDTEATSGAEETTDATESHTSTSETTAAQTKKAATIRLYQKQPEDNVAFAAENLFPGDCETKNFCVQVSHQGEVTVHFRADVRDGYEKLAEVLKVRVTLLTTGETLYDGLMRDMPKSVTHKMTSTERTTNELYYEVAAYLDTSVGNEYQNKALVADFRWWVEETDKLTPPDTGDNSHILLWVTLAAASAALCVIVLLLGRRKKKEDAA